MRVISNRIHIVKLVSYQFLVVKLVTPHTSAVMGEPTNKNDELELMDTRSPSSQSIVPDHPNHSMDNYSAEGFNGMDQTDSGLGRDESVSEQLDQWNQPWDQHLPMAGHYDEEADPFLENGDEVCIVVD